MNQFGFNQKESLCNKIRMAESMVDDLKKNIEDFKNNQHADFTDLERSDIDYSLKKTEEAVNCLHLSLLNLKKLFG